MICFLAAAVAIVAAMIQRYGGADHRHEMENRRFGRGPYVTCHCEPSIELLARMAEVVQQLRDTVVKQNWPVDWSVFEKHQAQAASAAQAGDLAVATREHLHTITSLMAQVRQIRNDSDGDDTIPL